MKKPLIISIVDDDEIYQFTASRTIKAVKHLRSIDIF
jgi:hypothetical protein